MEAPQLPPKIDPEKEKAFKKKIDQLKDKILKDYKKQTIGIALLPPKIIHPEDVKYMTKEEIQKEKEKISVLVVLDDSKSEHTPDYKIKDKISPELVKIAKAIDEKIWLEISLISEIRESLFDGKYELLQVIAMSAILHDPTDFLAALKISEVHKNMTIKKFEKYIVSYIGAGTLFRGEKSNDIDVYIVIDDTDVRRMSRAELKEKLRGLIQAMAIEASAITGVKKQFHVQTYILTDFWESVKDAHPVIFTFLRDGVPIFDRGLFGPWRLLLKMGRVRPSPESIDMHMSTGERLLEAAKKKLLYIASEDMYYAILNPSQAALMLYGISPPTPKETVRLLEEIFVKREKLLEPKYVKILERVKDFFKGMEHGKIKEVSGAEVDKIIKDVEDYLNRIKKLFAQIEKKTEKEDFKKFKEAINLVTRESLASGNIKTTNLTLGIKKYCEQEGLPTSIAEDYKLFEKTIKDLKAKKITKEEVQKVKRQSRNYIRVLEEHLQRKKFLELQKSKISFRYGKDKFGELLLLDDQIFIIELGIKDKEIKKSKLKEDGTITKLEKSDIKELDNILASKELLKRNGLKLKTIDGLKKLYGNKLEIVL